MSRPILIIEDDPDIAEVLRYSLEARKFETRVAFTGKEGLISFGSLIHWFVFQRADDSMN